MRILKHAVKETVAWAPAWRVLAPLRQPRCLVLAYHRVGRGGDVFHHVNVHEFRRQMIWIKRHCNPIAPEELQKRASPGRRPRVLVTFDDGYRDYFELAYPVLRELNIPAVNFLSTRHVDTGEPFWWDRVNLAGHVTRKRKVTLPWPPHASFDVTDRSRRALLHACKHTISSAPDRDRDRLLQDVYRAFDVTPEMLDLPRQVMTWDEVRASMDITRYGGHTHTHVRVSRVPRPQLEAEIRTCRERLIAETGVPPTLFAYPIGDGSLAARELLPRFGFSLAFSIHKGYVDRAVDWLNVPRLTGPDTLGELAWLATGQVRFGPVPALEG